MPKVSPELDFTSEQFDPVLALAAKDLYLPYPKAKIYNNLADWYSHTFNKKKNDILPNQESKTASKNNCYVLKRNYEWYYETLGLDLPHDFDIQSRYKKYSKRKRNPNGKYQIDKKVVIKEMPSEMLQPMRSSKILIKRYDGSLRDVILVNTDTTVCTEPTPVENVLKFENSNTKKVKSICVPDSKLCNKRSKLSNDSIGDSANFSESEIPHNTVLTNKECFTVSDKNVSPSLTNDCTNALSKSIETSRKDIDPKNHVFDGFHHKAIQDNSSLSLRKHKSLNGSINVKNRASLQNHSEIISSGKDNSKSAVLLSTDKESISALKESSSKSPDFVNSEFSKIKVKLSNVDKPVNIQSATVDGNSNLNVSTTHLTAKVSDKTSNLKAKTTYNIPQKPYCINTNNFVLPVKSQNEKEKGSNKRKFEKTENLSANSESINNENKLSDAEDVSSANTIACEVLNKIPDLKLYKDNTLNKAFDGKSTLKSSGTKLSNKIKGKYCKNKYKASNVTGHRKIKTVNNSLNVFMSPAILNLNITSDLELNSCSNLEAKHSENSASIVSSFKKSPYNKGVNCKSDQPNDKSVNNESIMITENSNTSVKYLSCITNKTTAVVKGDSVNFEANSIPSISNSTVLKKLPCEGNKIKVKSATEPINVLNKVENSLSKSIETSRKDIDPKNHVFVSFHRKAIQDNSSLSLKKLKHKSLNESINLKSHVSLQNHSEIISCVKDNSKSAVLLPTDEVSISALKESSCKSPDFVNSEFSKMRVKLSNADKPVNIQSTAVDENYSLNVPAIHLTAKVSDKTSNLKHTKTHSSILLSTNCVSIDTENKLCDAEDVSSTNTLVCEVLNKVPDLKLCKYNTVNKVFKKNSSKSSGTKLLNKKKGKYCKNKHKTSSVTGHRKIKNVNKCLDVSMSPADVNLNITSDLELKNSCSNLEVKHTENSISTVSSFKKSPYKKGVYCKSDRPNDKSINNESMKTKNSNTSVKYLSCITNKTPEVEKDDSFNLETNSISSISNSTGLKKLPCEGAKFKSKSATEPSSVLNEVENSNTLNGSRKSYYAVEKLNEISNVKKNDCNLQDKDPVAVVDTLFNLQDGKDITCKKNLSDAEVFNHSNTNEAENSAFVISDKSVSTCEVDKAPNLEFKKCNSLSPRKNSNSIPSIILIPSYDKENKHTNVKSVNSLNTEGEFEIKDTISESARLFSPLKSLNAIPDIEFKKCDNFPTESCLIKSSIVKSPCSKGNTKELALLELARRARKRLHMQ